MLAGAILAPPLAASERVYYAQTESARALDELAGAARTIAGVEQTSTDPDRRAVLLRGTEAQLKVAEWLLVGLESLSSEPEEVSQVREYAVPDGGEVVRLFHLRFASSLQASQEAASAVRVTTETSKMYLYNPPHALAVRGSVEQVRIAVSLIDELDQPPDRRPVAQQDRFSTVHQYPGAGPEDVLRVFYMPHGTTPQGLQEASSALRVIAVVNRVFLFNESHALVVRAKPYQISMAEWMLREAENLGSDDPASRTPPKEYSVPRYQPDFPRDNGTENVVRLYRLISAQADSEIEGLGKRLHAADVHKFFVLRGGQVAVVRGTPEQMDAADKVLARH